VTPAPFLASLNRRLGSALLFCGWSEGAAQAFRDVIRLSPGLAAAHFGLGEALARRQRWSAACDAFREAVRLAPGDVEAHGNLLLALGRCRRSAAAVRVLLDLIRLRPNQPELHLLRGALLIELGRPGEAIAALRWAARLPAPPCTTRFFLGEALLGAEGWRSAAASLAAARSLRQPHPAIPAPTARRRPQPSPLSAFTRQLAARLAEVALRTRLSFVRAARRSLGRSHALLGRLLARTSPHRAIRSLRYGARLRAASS
jgi:tetratricopeptide (TPR) repeat protein